MAKVSSWTDDLWGKKAEGTTLTIILCAPFVDTALVVERRWRQEAKENTVMYQLVLVLTHAK